MKNKHIKLIGSSSVIIAFLTVLLLQTCSKEEAFPFSKDKISGVSFEGTKNEIPSNAFDTLISLNAGWICFMPFAFLATGGNELSWGKKFWWGETTEGIIKCVTYAKQKNLSVMLKPHIWIWDGSYTGKLDLILEADWQRFEESYKDYILHFASVADSLNIELFCIGNELGTFIAKRPMFWQNLILEVRSVYEGKITYAGNWDDYSNSNFLTSLDYIGVNAYFPLSEKQDPEIAELESAWKKWIDELNNIALQTKKPILFTEYGYRSIDFACKEPWNSSVKHPLNMELQSKAYKALLNTFKSKEWFAGGFVWKWHYSMNEHHMDTYTPQWKPAENILKEYFKLLKDN